MTSITLLHVSASRCHSQGLW